MFIVIRLVWIGHLCTSVGQNWSVSACWSVLVSSYRFAGMGQGQLQQDGPDWSVPTGSPGLVSFCKLVWIGQFFFTGSPGLVSFYRLVRIGQFCRVFQFFRLFRIGQFLRGFSGLVNSYRFARIGHLFQAGRRSVLKVFPWLLR